MSHAGHEVPAAHDLTEHKGLNEGTLTFFGTLMIGLASVAPAYSLAATLGYVVIEDGTLAPVAVVLGFIPMLLTAFAYRELNKVILDGMHTPQMMQKLAAEGSEAAERMTPAELKATIGREYVEVTTEVATTDGSHLWTSIATFVAAGA